MDERHAKGKHGIFLTVADLAAAKKLPLDFLTQLGVKDIPGGGVSIPYQREDGSIQFTRERDNPRRTNDKGDPLRFFQPSGKKTAPYGLDRLEGAKKEGTLFIVEGESDCWAGWFHGQPVLGIPGSSNAGCLLEEHLDGFQTVYVLDEKDMGAPAFLDGTRKKLNAIGWTGDARVLRLPEGLKDLADLHADNPDRFDARLNTATIEAKSLFLDKSSGAAFEWPDPTPLAEVPEAPPFPLEVFPEKVRRLVREIGWAMNVPHDLVAIPVLALAGGAIGNAMHIAVTRSHTESPCLYAAIVSPPGTLKSPVLKMLRRPLDQAQKRYTEEWKRKVAEWEKEAQEKRKAKPVLRRCIVSESTTESLTTVLTENPRGVVMVRDELVALVSGMNQYKAGGKGSDRQIYLQLWSGDNILLDRRSHKERNGEPYHLISPFLSIIGGLQPGVLEKLRGDEDGFLDRFLFGFPARLPAVGERWRGVQKETEDDWKAVIDSLLSLEMVKEQDADGDHERPFFARLNADARAEWKAFTDAHAEETNDPDFPPHLLGPWAKLRGYCARLVLILHELRDVCGESTDRDIEGESMRRAALLTDYFKGHARKVYAVMDADPKIANARHVLRWLDRHPEPAVFAAGFVQQGLKSHTVLGKPENVEASLSLLELRGYIRQVPEPADRRPGRPTHRYERNPKGGPLNPGNPGNGRPGGDFQDFQDLKDHPQEINGEDPDPIHVRAS